MLAYNARVDRQRADVREQHGVAVRRGLGDVVRADVAVGAGAVFHDDRLSPGRGDVRADGARQDVRGAARGEGDDDADRLVRVLLASSRQSGEQARGENSAEGCGNAFHGCPPGSVKGRVGIVANA
jgi:hypothetical protein